MFILFFLKAKFNTLLPIDPISFWEEESNFIFLKRVTFFRILDERVYYWFFISTEDDLEEESENILKSFTCLTEINKVTKVVIIIIIFTQEILVNKKSLSIYVIREEEAAATVKSLHTHNIQRNIILPIYEYISLGFSNF